MATAILIYSVLMIALVAAVVSWGLKTNQFRKQERAGHLPLEVEEPVKNHSEE